MCDKREKINCLKRQNKLLSKTPIEKTDELKKKRKIDKGKFLKK